MDLPPEKVRTISEINSKLFEATDTSGNLTGPACPDIDLKHAEGSPSDLPVTDIRCPGGNWPDQYADEQQNNWNFTNVAEPLLNAVNTVKSTLTSLATLASNGEATQQPASSSLAWHHTQYLLAASDSSDGVQLYDMAPEIPKLGQPNGSVPAPLHPLHILKHDLQSRVASLAWRPNSGIVLAVGGASGVCLWNLGKARSSKSTGAGNEVATMTWLQTLTTAGKNTTVNNENTDNNNAGKGGFVVESLSWHPKGRLLAGASKQAPGLFVWDAASGSSVPLRAGLETVSLLSWSPCGSYLLAGHTDGSFRLWETSTWWSARWSASPGAGFLKDASWSPDGRALLVAYTRQVSMLHLTGEPPSLGAQVLPATLPGLVNLFDDHENRGSGILAAKWDSRGTRLAIALDFTVDNNTVINTRKSSNGPCVALYDARCDPLLTARLIGVMRLTPFGGSGRVRDVGNNNGNSGDEDWELVEDDGVEGEEGKRRSATAGRSENLTDDGASKSSVKMVFHDNFSQGALLAVRSGDVIATVPMFFVS